MTWSLGFGVWGLGRLRRMGGGGGGIRDRFTCSSVFRVGGMLFPSPSPPPSLSPPISLSPLVFSPSSHPHPHPLSLSLSIAFQPFTPPNRSTRALTLSNTSSAAVRLARVQVAISASSSRSVDEASSFCA